MKALNVMLAKDLMTIDPEYVNPETSLREVIATMNRYGYRHLPVLENGQVVGIITDRDIRLVLNSPVLDDEPLTRITVIDSVVASDCMTQNPLSVTGETPIYEVAGIFAKTKFGALLVMNNGRLDGIITVIDLLNQLALKPD